MKTLIIYDNEGYIISTMQGQPSPRKPVGVPYIEIEIPEGKQLIPSLVDDVRVPQVDVSVEPHQLILEDIPPTENDLIKQEVQTMQEALNFIIMGGM